MANDIFGFPSEASNSAGGDFVPIIKYDARAGRMSRRDRMEVGGAWESHAEDITTHFKALCDLENIEVGWMDFPPGGAPQMHLVKMGNQLPPKPGNANDPNNRFKYGLRFMLKLAKDVGGEKPIRELAGTSKAFRAGMQALVTQYMAERSQGQNQGLLPVVILEKTVPQTTGSAGRSSTNYAPVFRIIGWAPRGDLVFVSKAQPAQPAAPVQFAQPLQAGFNNGGAPPATGAQRATPPQQVPPQTFSVDDFG